MSSTCRCTDRLINACVVGDAAAKGLVSSGVWSNHCPTGCSLSELKEVGPALRPGITPEPMPKLPDWSKPSIWTLAH
eukprot:3633173-Pyramimonas_sp.AAC.1